MLSVLYLFAKAFTPLRFDATVFTFAILPPTLLTFVIDPATVFMFVALPATEVTLLLIPATVFTFEIALPTLFTLAMLVATVSISEVASLRSSAAVTTALILLVYRL